MNRDPTPHSAALHRDRSSSRQLNVRLLVASLVMLAILCPLVYIWHQYQLKQVSAALLERATQLENEGDDQQAATYFFRCLQLSDDNDAATRDLTIRLAKCYDRALADSNDKGPVIKWYYRAIGQAPDDLKLQERLAELFLETKQFVLADEQATSILRQTPEHSGAVRILALAHYGQLQRGRPILPSQVLEELQAAHRRAAGDVDVAEALANMFRQSPPADNSIDPKVRADAVLDVLVRNAPDNYRAYLARHRYRLAYHAAVDDADIRRALELAPDEPEVILAAADFAQREGQWKASVSPFTTLTESHPDEFRGYLGLGEAYYRLGQIDAAIETWRSGLQQVTRGRLPLSVRLTDALIEDRRLDEAKSQLKQLDAAIRLLTTTDGEAQRDWVVASRDLLMAKLLMQQDAYREAVPLLQRVATTAKSDRSQQPEASPSYQAWLLLGQAYLQIQEWEDAATSFQRALQAVPSSLTARIWAARAWAAVGRDDEAIVLCEQAAARPNAPEDVWLMLAQLHLRSQLKRPPGDRDWDRLEEVLQQAATALPDSWEIPLVRVNLLLARNPQQELGRAMQILLAEEASHPNSVPFWANLVFLYERLGMPTEADRALAHLGTIEDDQIKQGAWHVALLAARGQYQDAAEALAPLSAESESDRIWIERARLFIAYQKGDLHQIRSELLSIQQRRPQGTEVLAQLADLALAEQNWVEADRWIDALRAAEGVDGVWWRFFQARRLLASDSTDDSSFQRVVTLHQELLRLKPWWPGTAMLDGLIAERQGRTEEARLAYARAIRGGFQQPHVYERLVRTLYQQGEFEEASQWLQQLQQQAPLDVRLMDLAWSAAAQRNQLELAVELARQNLKQHPQDAGAYVWLAQMLSMRGEMDEADQLVAQAEALQPEDAGVWTGLLAHYLRKEDRPSIDRCLRALNDHPDLSLAERSWLSAQTYQRLGDRAAAESAYQRAVESDPDNPDLRVRYAVFLHPSDPERAEEILRRTLDRSPNHAGARRVLATWLHGRDDDASQQLATELLTTSSGSEKERLSDRRLEAVLLMRRGTPRDLQTALTILESLVNDSRSATDQDRMLLARLYERTGNLAAAESLLQSLVDGTSPTARHLATYTDFLLRHDRLDDARRILERLEAQAAMSLSSVSLRSRLLLAIGQTQQIGPYVESFARGQLAELNDPSQRRQLMMQVAQIFQSVGAESEAERWYETLVQEFPQDREALADFWMTTNKPQQALSYAWQQIETDATADAVALYLRLLVRQPENTDVSEAAKAVIERTVLQNPRHPGLLFAVASLYLREQKTAQAVDYLRKLTEVSPNHVTAWNNLAAILADDPAQLDEALRCADRAIAVTPRPVANLLDTKAMILIQMGRNEDAVNLLQRVLALPDSGDPRFHFHLAVAQARIGQTRAAEQSWDRAKRLGLFDSFLTHYERQLATGLEQTLGRQQDES